MKKKEEMKLTEREEEEGVVEEINILEKASKITFDTFSLQVSVFCWLAFVLNMPKLFYKNSYAKLWFYFFVDNIWLFSQDVPMGRSAKNYGQSCLLSEKLVANPAFLMSCMELIFALLSVYDNVNLYYKYHYCCRPKWYYVKFCIAVVSQKKSLCKCFRKKLQIQLWRNSL